MNAERERAVAGQFRSSIEASALKMPAEPYSIFEPGQNEYVGLLVQSKVEIRDAGIVCDIPIDSG